MTRTGKLIDKRRPRRSAHHAGEFLAPSIAGDFADKPALKKSRRSGTKVAFNGEVYASTESVAPSLCAAGWPAIADDVRARQPIISTPEPIKQVVEGAAW